ncbi:Clp protease N-terminal domain-containing protein [Saccharothrix algeriensis]|uniref:Clp protease n=1 Tax=Saccharothrix algeriensis TaxID=173560 RepID=A0A8T8HS33_9PSEU|nr:Clp protease N-terminal domain-containing protein [Saccharothrix algeriensis]MBM7812505.1 ATP-dependent Clp protease ATP-binding subunit ClpA [Saccharothrix algeriensis]QTR01237.1 Clp protease [Saccharothrix algeriensis]
MIGERFTREARTAVQGAVEEARRAAATEVAPEHLLLAVLDAPVLASFGVRRDEVEADLRSARRRGGLSGADAAALQGLGIDVDEVVASVERSLGEGALAAGPAPKRRWFGPPFTAAVKRVVARGLVEARDLGHGTLGEEHLVLALLSGPGLAAEVLGARGVDYPGVRRRVAGSPR